MSELTVRGILRVLIVSCILVCLRTGALSATAATPPCDTPRAALRIDPHAGARSDPMQSEVERADLLVSTAASEFHGTAPFGRAVRPTRPSPQRTLILTGIAMIPFDHSIVDQFPRIPSGGHCDGLTAAVSSLGDAKTIMPAIAGLYALGDRDDRKTSLTVLSAMINGAVLTQGIKIVVGRRRPGEAGDEFRLMGPGHDSYNSSFPSGHTSLAFSVATVMASHEPRRRWLYYGLATAVGVSRIRKGAHFPSDVLVGAGTGIFAGKSAIDSEGRPLRFKF